MVKTISYKNQSLPFYVAEGRHSQYIMPIALQVCKGSGLDIGCKYEEWAFPGSMPIDPVINPDFHALNIPQIEGGWDYIFSSHCLEHVDDYLAALKYWIASLKQGGTLFLYLPHPECLYWQPWNMRDGLHKHIFVPSHMRECFESLGLKNVYHSERDLSWSFAIFGEKA